MTKQRRRPIHLHVMVSEEEQALIQERMAEAGVKNVSLTNLDTIAQVGAEEGYIAPEDVSRLLKFRDNPSDESWINGGKN